MLSCLTPGSYISIRGVSLFFLWLLTCFISYDVLTELSEGLGPFLLYRVACRKRKLINPWFRISKNKPRFALVLVLPLSQSTVLACTYTASLFSSLARLHGFLLYTPSCISLRLTPCLYYLLRVFSSSAYPILLSTVLVALSNRPLVSVLGSIRPPTASCLLVWLAPETHPHISGFSGFYYRVF